MSLPIEIESLAVRNFLSVGNVPQTLLFNKDELTLILGSSADDPNARNGAGKTTILQAICYAIFGKPLTNIKIPNLVNNVNGKHMVVTLTFRQGTTVYRIERGKKPDFTRLFVNENEFEVSKTSDTDDEPEILENGEDRTLGANKNTQDEINRIFRMSLTLFRHIVGLNTFSDPFLKLSGPAQRAIVEEMFSVTILSEKAKVLNDNIKTTKADIEKEQKHIDTLSKANGRIQNAIDQTMVKKNAWNDEHQKKIIDLQNALEAIEGVDFAEQIALFDALDEYHSKTKDFKSVAGDLTRTRKHFTENMISIGRDIESSEAELKKDQSASLVRLGKERSRKLSSVSEIKTAIKTMEDEISKLQHDLDHPDEHSCTTCGQSLHGTDHLAKVMSTIERKIETNKTKIKTEKSKIATIEKEIKAIDKEESQTVDSEKLRKKGLNEKLETLNQQFASLEHDLGAIVDAEHDTSVALENLGDAPSPMFESRDDVYAARQMHDEILKSHADELAKENPFTSQIEMMRGTMEPVDYTDMNEIVVLQKHQEYLLKLLTDKNSFIRKRIIDQNLVHLNKRITFYLDKLGLLHRVRFQPDLSATITKIGIDYDYDQLSRGEMCRVNMAMALSFRDVWESMNHSINLLWIDELLDQGLDTLGVNNALSVIKTIARNGKSVFLISHREELISRIDRVLHVVKVDDFTTLVS